MCFLTQTLAKMYVHMYIYTSRNLSNFLSAGPHLLYFPFWCPVFPETYWPKSPEKSQKTHLKLGNQVAVSRQALGDTNAGTIELTHNPLINGAWSSRLSRIRIDEVTSPPQRQGFTTQIQTFHQSGNGILQEIFWKLFKLWSIRSIESIDGTGTTYCRNTTCLWFFVNDSGAGITNHIHTNLAFYDAWAETLIHQLTSGSFTACR